MPLLSITGSLERVGTDQVQASNSPSPSSGPRAQPQICAYPVVSFQPSKPMAGPGGSAHTLSVMLTHTWSLFLQAQRSSLTSYQPVGLKGIVQCLGECLGQSQGV